MAKYFNGLSNTPKDVELFFEHDLIVFGIEDQKIKFDLHAATISHLTKSEIILRKGMTFLEIYPEDPLFAQIHHRISKKSKAHTQRAILMSLGVAMSLLFFLYTAPMMTAHLPDKYFEWIIPSAEKLEIAFKACEMAPDDGTKILTLGGIKTSYKIMVIDLPMKNAFAFPLDKIFITMELLKTFKSDDELLALIGHEIGHHELKHYKAGVVRYALINFLGPLFGEGAMSALLMNTFSRAQEREADHEALKFLKHSGHSALGAKVLMETLDADGTFKLPAIFSTHPQTLERIAFFKHAAAGIDDPKGLKPLALTKNLLKKCSP